MQAHIEITTKCRITNILTSFKSAAHPFKYQHPKKTVPRNYQYIYNSILRSGEHLQFDPLTQRAHPRPHAAQINYDRQPPCSPATLVRHNIGPRRHTMLVSIPNDNWGNFPLTPAMNLPHATLVLLLAAKDQRQHMKHRMKQADRCITDHGASQRRNKLRDAGELAWRGSSRTAVVNQAAPRLGLAGFHPHAIVFAYKLRRHMHLWLRNKWVTVMGWKP
ncbi:hypothetical protein SAMN03159495_5409 [Pseudomonas sp. NFR16]|nr:hypothetical protein SAMN03159495_5409 [Pseudomonas sp. NFR16]